VHKRCHISFIFVASVLGGHCLIALLFY